MRGFQVLIGQCGLLLVPGLSQVPEPTAVQPTFRYNVPYSLGSHVYNHPPIM